MRKPRGVQIRANRLIGPGKCLVGTIDECPPRGEVVQRALQEAAQEPRGSGPLPSTPARARGSSVRATPSLHPPRILKTISLFYRKEDPEKSRLRGRLQLFFLSLVWGFPIVAAGIPFVVDHPWEPTRLVYAPWLYFSPVAAFNCGFPASSNFLFSASLFFSSFAGCTK